MRLRVGVALAAHLLARRLSVGKQNGDVAVGLGADFLRALTALGAELAPLPLPFGLHALVHRLAVLLRQVGAPDADVDDVDAERLRLAVELVAHARHQLGAIVAHDFGERRLAEHAAQRRIEQDRQAASSRRSTEPSV